MEEQSFQKEELNFEFDGLSFLKGELNSRRYLEMELSFELDDPMFLEELNFRTGDPNMVKMGLRSHARRHSSPNPLQEELSSRM